MTANVPSIRIGNKMIGQGHPVYIVAELSANHHQDYDTVVRMVHAARECGVDAIKLQTYTPDTITINCRDRHFQLGSDSPWPGETLYDLYSRAFTPWEWQPKIKRLADEIGLDCFSSPFDHSAVDFLREMDLPAYKIASFEIVDIPLIEYIARQGRPILISTGMATLPEIEEAVAAAKRVGNNQIVLLKCTSAYPAPPEQMNLRTIPHLAELFHLPVGLSDHSPGIGAAVASVALGAAVIEKHFTLSRSVPGPDSAFSLEPHEFKELVENVRLVEKALGEIHCGPTATESVNLIFRRSLFVVRDVRKGEKVTPENVRSIRPGNGLHPRSLPDVLDKTFAKDVPRGTPLNPDLLIY